MRNNFIKYNWTRILATTILLSLSIIIVAAITGHAKLAIKLFIPFGVVVLILLIIDIWTND